MTLENGRPADCAGRLEKEIRVYDLLDTLGVSYERVDHQAAMTMEDCREVDEALQSQICKNLLLCNRQKTAFYLLMISGEKRFKTSAFSKQIGSSRLSFADGEYMEQFLDITPGSLSVLGLMNDTESRVQLVMDRPVAEREMLGCHPCVNTASLRLRTRDVLERFLPEVGHSPIIVDLPEE